MVPLVETLQPSNSARVCLRWMTEGMGISWGRFLSVLWYLCRFKQSKGSVSAYGRRSFEYIDDPRTRAFALGAL